MENNRYDCGGGGWQRVGVAVGRPDDEEPVGMIAKNFHPISAAIACWRIPHCSKNFSSLKLLWEMGLFLNNSSAKAK